MVDTVLYRAIQDIVLASYHLNTLNINCIPVTAATVTVTVTVPKLLHCPIHSPQPPLSPSFILLSPQKFMNEI